MCFLEVRGQQQYGQGSSSASNRPEAHAVVQVCIYYSSPALRLIWIDALVWKSPGTWTMLLVREHVGNLLHGCCMLQHSMPRRTLPLWLNFKTGKNSTVIPFIGLHVLCDWPTCKICIRPCVVVNLRILRLQLSHHSLVCVSHCNGAKLLVMSSLSSAAATSLSWCGNDADDQAIDQQWHQQQQHRSHLLLQSSGLNALCSKS